MNALSLIMNWLVFVGFYMFRNKIYFKILKKNKRNYNNLKTLFNFKKYYFEILL